MKLKLKLIKKIKEITKYFIYFLINKLVKPSLNIESKSILLIRLDAIGDYVLFRNFIEILKTNTKYKDYSITLVGNEVWKSLSKELDNEYIDNFVWLNRSRFASDFEYRYKKLKEITSQGYEIILSPVYSREFFYGDNIVKLVTAREKIGNVGDLSNIKKWQKNISDKYYTKLIPARNEIIFEFYRNKEFFENLFGEEINIKKPYIDCKLLMKVNNSFELPEIFVALFIGASNESRKWPVEKFIEVGNHLKQKYGFEIILCGGIEDLKTAERFNKIIDENNFINLIGKTSLIDMLMIIKKASFLISNETFVPHVCVALDTPVLVISNGNHFGRFVPYPSEMTDKYFVIYHPEIEKDLKNYQKLINSYGYGSKLDINEISTNNVIEKLDKIFNCRKATIL